MSTVNISTPFNIGLDFEVAALQRRIAAWATDMFILVLYILAAQFVLEITFKNSDEGMGYGVVLTLFTLPMLLYHLVFELIMQGQSPGKKLWKLRVISLEGGEPDVGQYVIRWIFRVWEWPLIFNFLPMDNLGLTVLLIIVFICGSVVLMVIGINRRSQRLGDIAAGTAVVNSKQFTSISDTIFQEINYKEYQVMYPEVMKLSDRDINAIKTVLNLATQRHSYETAHRVATKIKEVLQIESTLEVTDFLEKLLSDYNYLATKDK